MKKNIVFIFGTRPEVIKLAPLILEFKKYYNDFNINVCNTEQQKELSNQALEYFSVKSDMNLDIMTVNQTLSIMQQNMLSKLDHIYIKNKIDATIVQGDTMSAFTGALASFYNKIPVFHIEAGLRSYNLFEPFPEEALRQMITRISDLHFAPTEINRQSLIKENINKDKIFVTGNTAIDALSCITAEQLNIGENIIKGYDININDRIILVTVHRRENHGDRLISIIEALKILIEKYQNHIFILPLHPNPNVKNKINDELSMYKNVRLTKPLSYPSLIFIMSKAKLILTDSGGIQEEAPTFSCPVLVLRYETERIEGIKSGHSILVGANKENIVLESDNILSKDFLSSRIDSKENPYGDGKASVKIIDIIKQYF